MLPNIYLTLLKSLSEGDGHLIHPKKNGLVSYFLCMKEDKTYRKTTP